jgi:hypothetical protein
VDQLGAVIDFNYSKMSLTDIGKLPRAQCSTHRTVPIFAESKVGRSQPLRKQVVLGEGRQITGDFRPEMTLQDAKT